MHPKTLAYSFVVGTLLAIEKHALKTRPEQNHHKKNNQYKQNRKQSIGKTHQEIKNGRKPSTAPWPKSSRVLQMLKEILGERFLSNDKEINFWIRIPI